MTRPTQANVTFELDQSDQAVETATQLEWRECARVLAAEVRALQAELESLRSKGCGGALATLARVEALPTKWLDCEGEHCRRCAGELDAALRGKP